MTELTAVSDIIWSKQDADIAVKLGLLALAGTARCSVISVQGQVPPQLITHAFLGVDVTINRLLTNMLLGTFIDHPVADLLGRPSGLETVHNALTQLRMPDQLTPRGSPPLRPLMRRHTKVSRILLRKGIIGPEIAFNLSEDRRLVTL